MKVKKLKKNNHAASLAKNRLGLGDEEGDYLKG